jgi:hypothetical protein
MTNKIFTALTGLLLAWASVACKTTEDQNTPPKGGGNTIAEAAAARPQSFKSDDDMLDYIRRYTSTTCGRGPSPPRDLPASVYTSTTTITKRRDVITTGGSGFGIADC